MYVNLKRFAVKCWAHSFPYIQDTLSNDWATGGDNLEECPTEGKRKEFSSSHRNMLHLSVEKEALDEAWGSCRVMADDELDLEVGVHLLIVMLCTSTGYRLTLKKTFFPTFLFQDTILRAGTANEQRVETHLASIELGLQN